jgi:hypothetical protein
MRTMMMADEKNKSELVINEKFMAEWLRYGFAEMQIYMVKQAQFEAWCVRHPRDEESDGGTDPS